MGNTIHHIPLAVLPEDFFVEELQYKRKAELEELLKNPPQKKENATIKLYLRDAFLNDEDFENIKAYAPESAILKALEEAKKRPPIYVYDINGNLKEIID